MTLLKNFHFLAPILVFFASFFTNSSLAGPINVRIETDNAQDFHIGPEPRTRFELVEQYSPLATAKLATGVGKDGQQQPARALSSSLSKFRQPIRPSHQQPVQIIVDFGEAGRENSQTLGQKEPIENGALNWPQPADQEQQIGARPTLISRSQWLDWTKWSQCNHGQRFRIRKCLMINNVPCVGKNEEFQICYSANSSDIKFGDPSIIEREIMKGK